MQFSRSRVLDVVEHDGSSPFG